MKKILTLAIAALAIGGCKKEGDDKNPTPQVPVKTKTELLTEGKWQLVEIYDLYITAGDTQKTNYFENDEECDKDDMLIFGTDGTLIADMGAIKCDSPNEVQTEERGKWKFIDADTRIVVRGTHSSEDDTLNIEVTESLLRFSLIYYDDVGKGDVHEVQEYKNVK